jgi:hypothetical protein
MIHHAELKNLENCTAASKIDFKQLISTHLELLLEAKKLKGKSHLEAKKPLQKNLKILAHDISKVLSNEIELKQ